MIQANELRFGNWVYICGAFNEQTQVKQILTKGIAIPDEFGLNPEGTHPHNIYTVYWENIDPIPLTPEVMERVEGMPDEYYWINDRLWDSHGYYLSVPCTTLHHLQNLIFALTGEEITYKP